MNTETDTLASYSPTSESLSTSFSFVEMGLGGTRCAGFGTGGTSDADRSLRVDDTGDIGGGGT